MNERGIEANPTKIKALLDMKTPKSINEVQKLTGLITALGRFISRSTDKSVQFFDRLRGSKDFEWTKECNEDFKKLKEYLAWPSELVKVQQGEPFDIYLAVSEHAVSSALVKNEGSIQLHVYYISR